MDKKPHKKKRLTRDYLIRATYSYLQRFATTEKNLRDVLDRKVRRRLMLSGEEENSDSLYDEAQTWIEEIVTRAVEQNLVNDRSFAAAKSASLNRNGNSRRTISHKLQAKGVAPTVVDEVLHDLAEEMDDLDLDYVAAVKYLRKRRFGAFSLRHDGGDIIEKELASLCRAGFSYQMALKVLKMPRDELEEVMYQAGP
ncbi:regulatory protein RecX [Paremcibacter congregatus]|uniref:regulatory protein RecX n=1 Tax=Paremcibacter congregatus TaxID=2043170 RepID=UPI0030EF8E01|tara:strand:- start:2673 stop:3263 length:591 start_codon:yes stop_codon:yes gene_type:complete